MTFRILSVFSLTSLFSFYLLLLPSCTNGEEEIRPPNIILFLVDDMGWQDTSVEFHSEHTPFNDHFRTPNMERIASTGIRFTQAYAAPVCSPTRTSIMTGQSPVRHHVTNWTLFPDRDQSGETERLKAPRDWRKEGLQAEDLTLPKLLHDQGYFTIHSGKAHWGAHGTSGNDPANLGFDVNIAGHATGSPGHYHGEENYGNESPGEYTPPRGVPGLEKYHGTTTHLTDALTIEACQAIETSAKRNQPFYLYMAHYAVHTPIQEHRPYVDHYREATYEQTDIEIPEVEARYASMVEGMDASLGAILDKVESLGLAEKTIVLFGSDNGGLSAHTRGTTPMGTEADTHNWPLKAGKGSAYEGGTRVPMIVSWVRPKADHPSQLKVPIQSGSSSRDLAISEDFFPTICRLAGVEIPAEYKEKLDGVDLLGSITGAESVAGDRVLLFHYPHVWGPKGLGYEPHSSIRTGDWKAIYFYEPQTWELYDLSKDLGENHELSSEYPQELVRLAGEMRRLHERLDAQYPLNKVTDQEESPRWP